MPPWNDEHELDPITDAEPVDHAARPAQQEAAPRTRFARHGHQQRRQRHRRQPHQIESRKDQNQQDRREQRERASSACAVPRRRGSVPSASTTVGHVGTAHQRTAEHHLEAERQAVIAIRVELLAARCIRPRADCGAWAADTGRWSRRRSRCARRSRNSAWTSSSVSPSPTMKPDFVRMCGAWRRAKASTSSDCR